MLRALLFTIIIEVTIAFFLGYRKKDLLNVMLVNIMTNPIVTSIPVYFNIRFGLLERNISLFILEILAFLSEGYVYSKYLDNKKMNFYKLSAILNMSSYLIGILINYIWK